ncbi:MAG TPA: zf-HC2 domain-containing protein [Candidatus Acidoferrales bacterium]|nr:zf-HC2 domain-containing protein [Candidatus Acidoferrales bacterium]
MACDLWRGDIEAYADSELSPERRMEFDAHLRECASCAADVSSRMQFKRAVKRAGRRYTASAELRRKIEQQIAPRTGISASVWIPALATAAVALLAVGVWIVSRHAAPLPSAVSEVVDLHVAALASANPVDVISTDEHTVKPWFEGKLPFEVNVPDLGGTPLTLIGGRIAYLEQSPGAALLVQFKKHRMSVFIFQERADWKRLDTASKMLHRSTMMIDSWSEGGLRYFIVSGTGEETIRQLEGLLRKAAQP